MNKNRKLCVLFLILIIFIVNTSCDNDKLIIKSEKYIIYNDIKYNYIDNNFGAFGITSLIGDPSNKIFNWIYKINDDHDTNILLRNSDLYVKESFNFPNKDTCLISDIYLNKTTSLNGYMGEYYYNFTSIIETCDKLQTIKEINIINHEREILNFDLSYVNDEFDLIFRLYEYNYLCYIGYKVIKVIDDFYILSYDNKVYDINELFQTKILDAMNVIEVSMQGIV